MNRRIQLLHILRDNGGEMETTEIARLADTVAQNIHKTLRGLVDEELIDLVGERPLTYRINSAGQAFLAQPTTISQTSTESRRAATPIRRSDAIKVGVFTSGEIQIEAGGKRVTLSRDQSAELVEFLDSLPGRIFEKAAKGTGERASPFAALGVQQSRVHRIADSE